MGVTAWSVSDYTISNRVVWSVAGFCMLVGWLIARDQGLIIGGLVGYFAPKTLQSLTYSM